MGIGDGLDPCSFLLLGVSSVVVLLCPSDRFYLYWWDPEE
jgi:hypothetical protein